MAPNDQLLQKYVRVRERTASGFVQFDFAIGDPELYVELILPEAAFAEFCAHNAVRLLADDEAHRGETYANRY